MMESKPAPAQIQQILVSSSAINLRKTMPSPNKIGPYLLRDHVGEGGFAKIRAAVDEHGHKFACKIIPKRHGDQSKTMIEREIEILHKLDSPYVCHFYEFLEDSINCYIIMEYCHGQSLYDLIEGDGKLDEASAKSIFWSICQAVRYIHRSGIAHRDIKPENVIVDANSHAKLIDFGLSEVCAGLTTCRSGSCSYQSPEVLSGDAFDPLKADIWSLGVVLYAMVIGYLPWTRRTRGEVTEQIRSCQFFVPVTVSDACREAILAMMNPDCEQRWTIEQVMECEWLRDASPTKSLCPRPCVERRGLLRATWQADSAADVKTMLKQANRRVPVAPSKTIVGNRRGSVSLITKPIVAQRSFCWSMQ